MKYALTGRNIRVLDATSPDGMIGDRTIGAVTSGHKGSSGTGMRCSPFLKVTLRCSTYNKRLDSRDTMPARLDTRLRCTVLIETKQWRAERRPKLPTCKVKDTRVTRVHERLGYAGVNMCVVSRNDGRTPCTALTS